MDLSEIQRQIYHLQERIDALEAHINEIYELIDEFGRKTNPGGWWWTKRRRAKELVKGR